MSILLLLLTFGLHTLPRRCCRRRRRPQRREIVYYYYNGGIDSVCVRVCVCVAVCRGARMTFLLLIRHSSLHLAISSKRSLSLAHLRHPPLFFSFILFQFLSFVYSIYQLLLLLLLLETTIHLPSSSSSSCYTRAPTSITQRAPRTKRKREGDTCAPVYTNTEKCLALRLLLLIRVSEGEERRVVAL